MLGGALGMVEQSYLLSGSYIATVFFCIYYEDLQTCDQ